LKQILVMHSGVKEDGQNPGAVIFWGGKWSILNLKKLSKR
jgi:hypothetical protein